MATWLLIGVRAALSLSLVGYVVYTSLTVWAARHWSRERPCVSPDWTPAVTILKPVRGVDAEAWENFSSFCQLDYPPDRLQILFGALDADDPVLDLVRRLQIEFPDRSIQIVVAPPGAVRGNNRKVSNLLAMLPHARHELLVLCDSDMRVRPDYLRRIAAPFQPVAYHQSPGPGPQSPATSPQSPVGLVTCPYRGARPQSFAAIIEALSIGADFIPSTMVSRAVEGVSFALGSTIVLPQAILNQIGGFEPLLDELADDYRLGNGVFKAGYQVVLSDYVIESVLGRERFSAMWSRRLRWSRTLRVCRPNGYAGVIISHGFVLGLLFLLSTGFSPPGWIVFGAVTLLRVASALINTLFYTRDPAVLRYLYMLPVSDLLSAALYVASFFGRHIEWRGERFRLLPGGRLLRED